MTAKLLSSTGIAAAAAQYDPSLLLALQSTHESPKRRRVRLPKGETGAALLLVAAVVLALAWSNAPWGATYEAFWHARVALTAGPWTLGADLRTWIDEGLMTLFFLVVGLEAKHERDLGELRDGRRLTVPVLAGLGGMAASAAVYVAMTARTGASGWGVALSTDTALALGALSIATRDTRVRAFMLTLLVVDDVAALLVVSLVYPGRIEPVAVAVAAALLALLLTMRFVAGRQFRARGTSTAILTPLSVLTGVALWLALFESGIDPVASGLLIGLLTNAYVPAGNAPASPNERIQTRLHPLTSRVVVPLFALANAGLHIDGRLLGAAASSPITWGIILAYVVGKPLGIVAAAHAVGGRTRLTRRELRGTALATGIGFTLSLLIAGRAFHGPQLDEAKLGILATALIAPVLSIATLRARTLVKATPCAAAR